MLNPAMDNNLLNEFGNEPLADLRAKTESIQDWFAAARNLPRATGRGMLTRKTLVDTYGVKYGLLAYRAIFTARKRLASAQGIKPSAVALDELVVEARLSLGHLRHNIQLRGEGRDLYDRHTARKGDRGEGRVIETVSAIRDVSMPKIDISGEIVARAVAVFNRYGNGMSEDDESVATLLQGASA